MMKLNAKQLRKSRQSLASLRACVDARRGRSGSAISRQNVKRNDIYIILDNVLDTYNIGSIFRLADAVAAKKVYLCGKTETPPNPRIKKASINTTEWVEWEYSETAVEAIHKITSEVKKMRLHLGGGKPIQIIAIEQSVKSTPYDKFEYKLPICLVVGHESYGVSKEVLDIADSIVEIPMFGVNISLNVMVSLGIVLYKVMEKN